MTDAPRVPDNEAPARRDEAAPWLWVVTSRNTGADRAPYRDAHRAYMRELVARGVIFASGPTADDPEAASNGGVTVLRVSRAEDARRIMDDEPYVRAGARTYDLLAWHIAHGNYASA